MELGKLERLLEKYENAETTLEEESLLKQYFNNGHDIPAHLTDYKAIFSYFSESGSQRFTKSIRFKKRTPWVKWASVAAVFLIAASVFFYQEHQTDLKEQRARAAYEQTQEALLLVSKNLNRGNQVAISGLQEFEKAQNKVFNTNNNE